MNIETILNMLMKECNEKGDSFTTTHSLPTIGQTAETHVADVSVQTANNPLSRPVLFHCSSIVF